MGERRSSPRACPVLDTGVNNVSGGSCGTGSGQPACNGRPAHGEAAARLCVSHAAEHEEPAEATDALRPTCGGRGAESTPSWRPTDEAINPKHRTIAQRKERSTPNAGPVSSDGSDQLQPLNGCPTGEGLITPTAGLDRGRRTSVNSVVSARAACEGPASTPLRQHSLVGDQGRANHPPVMPVQQGPRTQVSMVGNLGESQTAKSLSPGPAPR